MEVDETSTERFFELARSFDRRLGKGAKSVVVHGLFRDQEAAFKFVQLDQQGITVDSSELRTIKRIEGSKIVRFYQHFR